jgi:hypothetical protein
MRVLPPWHGLFFIGLFFVYLPLVPIDQETQPFLALLPVVAYFMLALVRGNPRKVPISVLYVFALVLLIMFRLVLDATDGIGPAAIVWAIKYLVGPFAFIYATQVNARPSDTVLVSILMANFMLLMLLSVGPTAAVAQPLMDVFFGRYSGGDQFRGISLFSPEPSYAVNYIMLFFLFGFFYVDNERVKWLLLGIGLILLLFNRSLTAFAYCGAAAAWMFFKTKRSFRLLSLAFLAILVVGILNSERYALMATAAQQIDFSNIVLAASILEPSGTTRILINVLATLGGLSSIVGNGLGSFSVLWSDIVQKFGWLFYFDHEVIGRYYSEGIPLPPNSYLSSLIFDTGILGLLWFLVFSIWYFRSLARSGRSGAHIYFIAVFWFVNFIFQGQVSNPIPWAVMGLALSRVKGTKDSA